MKDFKEKIEKLLEQKNDFIVSESWLNTARTAMRFTSTLETGLTGRQFKALNDNLESGNITANDFAIANTCIEKLPYSALERDTCLTYLEYLDLLILCQDYANSWNNKWVPIQEELAKTGSYVNKAQNN